MELKKNLYSIEETAKLLGADIREVHHLAGEGNRLTKCPAITADSILDYARQKRITLAPEQAGQLRE
jgi:hypothetical protein